GRNSITWTIYSITRRTTIGMKKLEVGIPITIKEMFGVVEDFTDQLTHYRLDEFRSKHDVIMKVAEEVSDLFRENGIDMSVAIIILLQQACAMYHVAIESASASCPPKHLN